MHSHSATSTAMHNICLKLEAATSPKGDLLSPSIPMRTEHPPLTPDTALCGMTANAQSRPRARPGSSPMPEAPGRSHVTCISAGSGMARHAMKPYGPTSYFESLISLHPEPQTPAQAAPRSVQACCACNCNTSHTGRNLGSKDVRNL